MATTKKKTTAKTPVAKTSAARKTVKKTAPKKMKAVQLQSFKRSPRTTPFMTFKATQQTLYWIIILVLVFFLGTWVTYLNVKIQKIYDQVEVNSALHDSYDIPTKENPATKE